jgi:hypothetical protein
MCELTIAPTPTTVHPRTYYVRGAGVRVKVSRDCAFANDLTTYRVIHRLSGKMVDTSGVRTLKDPTT